MREKSRAFLVGSVLTERQPGAGRLLVNSRPFAGDRVQLRRQKYELSFTSRLAAKGSRLQYCIRLPLLIVSPTCVWVSGWGNSILTVPTDKSGKQASKAASNCMSVRCRSQEEEAALAALRMRDEQGPL